MGAQGTATLNFGAFPGQSHTTVAVTGQSGIVSGSLVEAWIRPEATADHTADEHMLETIRVVARDIVAGVGFTIHGWNTSDFFEPLIQPRGNVNRTGAATGTAYTEPSIGGKGTRIYGTWSIAWVWN